MAPNLDPQVASAIVAIVTQHAEGATLYDIIAGLPEEPTRRSASRWVGLMVESGELRVDTTRKPHVYFAADTGTAPTTSNGPAGANSPVPLSADELPPSPGAPGAEKPVRSVRRSTAPKAATTSESVETAAIADAVKLLTPIIKAALPAAVANPETSPTPEGGQKKAVSDLAKRIGQLLPAEMNSTVRLALMALPVVVFGLLAQLAYGHPLIALAVVVVIGGGIWVAIKVPVFLAKSPGLAVANVPGVANPPGSVAKVGGQTLAKAATPRETVAKAGSVANPGGLANPASVANTLGSVANVGQTLANPAGVPQSQGVANPDVAMAKDPVVANVPGPVAKVGGQTLANSAIRRARYLVLAGCAVLIAAVIGLAWYLQVGKRPTQADVSAMLVKSLAPLPVRVAALDLTYGAVGNTGCPVNFKVQFETTQPLVRKIDPTEYLRAHYPSEKAAIAAADALLRGPDGARLRAEANRVPDDQKPGVPAAGASGPPVLGPSGTQALGSSGTPNLGPSGTPVLVSVSAPPGSLASGSGITNAWQQNGVWVFTGTTLSVDRKVLVGELKPAGGLVVELPEDAAQLKTWVTDRAAYAAKVQAAATTLAAELEREREQRAETLTRLIARGSWFTGVVTNTAKSAANGVLLEVTSSSATTHQITMDLRNDRGVWTNTRPFKGDWSLNADGDTVTANVRTTIFDRIGNGGPVLDDTGAIYLTLQVRFDGTVNVNVREWRLERVADSDVAKTKLAYGWTAAGVRSQDSGAKEQGKTLNAELSTPNVQVGDPKASSSGSVHPALGTSSTPSGPPSVVGHPSSGSVHPALGSSGTQALGHSGTQVSAPALPPIASATAGAYVLDSNWLSLPGSKAKMTRSTPQKLSNALDSLTHWEDSLVGKTTDASTTPYGEMTLDAPFYAPAVSGREVVIAYVGPLTPVPADLQAKYPVLKTYPAVELAPVKTLANGTRTAPLYLIAPGFIGFGPTRVAATLETVSLPLTSGSSVPATLLRCTSSLAPGRYALSCGAVAYELVVE